MKSVLTSVLLPFLLLPLLSAPLEAQTTSDNPEKKIVITKKRVEADGSEVVETIIKKGKAAENFDVEAYRRDNEKEGTDLDIDVSDGRDERRRVRVYRLERSMENLENDMEELGDDLEELGEHIGERAERWADKIEKQYNCKSWGGGDLMGKPRGYMGVSEDDDEDSAKPGVVVDVTRSSAAEKAGLRSNDLILKLDNTEISTFDQLSEFMENSKPEQVVKVTYSRNGGAAQTADVTLAKNSCWSTCGDEQKRGFLGITDYEDNDDKEGVEVNIVKNSGAEKAGLKNEDILLQLDDVKINDEEDITDFMRYTKPEQQVKITYQRDGKTQTTTATLAEQKAYNFNFSNNWDSDEWSKNWGKNFNFNWDSREKEACLGVYTHQSGENDQQGAEIENFTSVSAAREVEMKTGDVIISVNGNRVKNHDELWEEIAAFKPADKVAVAFLRDGQPKTVEATLKACKDKSSRVQILENEKPRNFQIWNWDDRDKERLRENQVITIRKSEGDAPAAAPVATDRNLKLTNFKAYPNPTQGQITVEFAGEAMPTVVNLLDMAGRQLFREELNSFSGEYNQQFDLAAYSKGTIIIQVVQGDKVFSEQIVVN